MSSETLNFGPEWLRNLSHGGGGGNNITSPPLSPAVNSSSTKFKLAKHRYGREEMLALFEEDTKIPASLQALPHILSVPTLIPLTLTPITAEDQQAFSGGVNSETTFRGRGGGYGLGRSRGSTRGRGRGRGGTDFSRSISQNEEGIYPRGMTREYSRQSWDDRSTNRGIGVRHFDDPPPRGTKPLRRADVSGNWRDDAMRAGGDGAEVSPSPNPRVAGTGGGWRDTTRGGSSWRDWSTDNPGGSGGSYRPPNRNNQVIRRSVSTGGASTTTPPPTKYDSSNENGGNNFLPEWAGDDDGDTEVGVFDSTGAFLPRSSVSTASEAGKKGASASPSTATSSSSDNNNNGGNDKKKTRRQSTLHSTLDKIDEQNHNDVAAAGGRKTNHTTTTSSGQQSPSSSPTAGSTAAENHRASSSPPMGEKPPVANEPSPPTNNSSTVVPQSPIRPTSSSGGTVDDGTNNNHHVSSPHHDENLNKAKELIALQQQQQATTTSSEDGSVLRASSLIHNDVMSNDDYVPKAIPNTFQDPNKDAAVVGELLSRSKMNENFDGLAESTIRILDEADEQQLAPFNLFQHQQQQHEQVQQQPFDVATQHIKSLFASNQPSPMVSATPQPPAQANKWFYKDPQGEIQGPFNSQQMADWFKAGYFSSSLLVRRVTDSHFEPLGEMFRRHGRNPFTAPTPVVQPVQHVIQQQQSQLIDQQQQQQQFRQEMQFRTFLQHTKEVQEQQLQAFKSMLINNLNKNPEFCAMSGSQQQVTLNQQITIFQHQLNTQQQQQINQYLSNNAPSAAATARTIAAVSGGGGGGATATPIVGGSTPAGPNHPSQVAGSHHESLNPWEVDPAIVRRPSPGATQQEQQHFMQLLKKKTAEQEQRSALKAREDMELEEKRKMEMQQRFQQEEAMRQAEELRKQRELQLLYRQRMEEEQRLLKEEEEEKQKKIEEERLRQKLAKEEEVRMKKAEEAEQQRLMQEKKLEKQRKYEEERKRLVDEARRKKEQEEEERRRKRREEEELEKKRRAQEEEELKKKQAEEEYIRRQRELQLREARKKKEMEELKKLNLPSTAQWAAAQQVANPTTQRQPTVAEIQKIEEEREMRKRKQEQEQKRLQMQQAQKQTAAPVWGGNAAQHLASNHVVSAPSLAQIQREEAKKAKQRQESAANQQQKPAVVVAKLDQRPTTNNNNAAAAVNSVAVGGKWSNRVATKVVSPTTGKKSAWGGQTFQQTASHQPVAWDQPTLAQSNPDSKQFSKQQQVRGKRRSNPVASEKNNVVALFENSSANNPAKHSEAFFKWCSQEIGKIPQVANFDIPTVFAFLCDVQSPYEVKDYIHEVFGDSQVARDFGDAFLKKRAEAAGNNATAPKNQQQQLSTANQRKSASMSSSAAAAAAAAAAAELVTGNTKRGKRRQRKLQKIDPSILGFSVNAASDRVNMGEIDTPRDV